MFLGILNFFITCAFSALVLGASQNITETYKGSPTPSIVNLPSDIIVAIACFLDIPYLNLSLVCKRFKDDMDYMKGITKLAFQTKNSNPIFKDFVCSIDEIHRLIKINPIILKGFFKDFLETSYLFKIMNKRILEYYFPIFIERNSSNVQEIESFIVKLFNQFINQRKYDCVECLIILVSGKIQLSNDFHKNVTVNFELIQWLYKNKNDKLLIEFLIKIRNSQSSTISCIFNTQIAIEDLIYFFKGDLFKPWFILDDMKAAILDLKLNLKPQEKEYILNRNHEFLTDLPRSELETVNFDLVEVCNIVRYSGAVSNEAIVEKYFSDRPEHLKLRSDSSTETVAIAALLAGNVELFQIMHQLRNGRKFSVEFYEIVSTSRRLIDLLWDDVLLNFFDIPFEYYCFGDILDPSRPPELILFDLTLQLEILARKDAESHSSQDLDDIFFGDEFGKLIATAYYYSIENFIESLKLTPELIYPIIKICISYSSKVRNCVNNSIHVIHAALQLASNTSISYNAIDSDISIHQMKLLKMLVEPENADIIESSVFNEVFKVSSVTNICSELLDDSKFRNNMAISNAINLIKFDFRSFSFSNLLAHEIVQVFKVFGVKIENFEFDSIDDIDDFHLYVEDYFFIKIKQLNNGNFDKFLVFIALSDFDENQDIIENSTNRNPILMNNFCLFQLWWERNEKTFERSAPSEISAIFKDRTKPSK